MVCLIVCPPFRRMAAIKVPSYSTLENTRVAAWTMRSGRPRHRQYLHQIWTFAPRLESPLVSGRASQPVLQSNLAQWMPTDFFEVLVVEISILLNMLFKIKLGKFGIALWRIKMSVQFIKGVVIQANHLRNAIFVPFKILGQFIVQFVPTNFVRGEGDANSRTFALRQA